MNERLMCKHLEGIALSAEDEAALLRELDRDPLLAADCAAQARVHALLTWAFDPADAGQAMAARVRARLTTLSPVLEPAAAWRRYWLMPFLLASAAALIFAVFLMARPNSVTATSPPWCLVTDSSERELSAIAGRLRFTAGTRYRLTTADPNAPALELDCGRVEVVIDRHLQTPFSITTPGAITTVLGTAFSVAADAQGCRVAVQRGRVRLAGRQSGAVEIEPGYGSDCNGAGPPTVPTQLPPQAPILDFIVPDADLAGWRTDGSAGSRIDIVSAEAEGGIAVTGKLGDAPSDWTWMGYGFACEQDWRGADGITFQVQGEGEGLLVEAGGFRPEGGEYYFTVAPVPVQGPGWQTVVIPFTAFARYQGHTPKVSGPLVPILGRVCHLGFFPGSCARLAVRGIRLHHHAP